ncbi:MAG: hypothetical protein PHQ43_12785 [Dehalococcoidales bacterium]|nr:hypothetical protein [Dehalococcoidales bacterium]
MIKEKIDKVIDDYEDINRISEELEESQEEMVLLMKYPVRIHVYKHIVRMAQAVGAELQVLNNGLDVYPYTHQFTYRGAVFFELSKTKELEEDAK